ncbi:MAG TPA: ATP-dependent RecD-like DNA helicase [Candidatus Scatomorpha merdipullorum]|uniref:ATP-dependent RecD2 DNA helicase n=1 Tax=Candidatus Scatomorpha merdipullorum TaxID=2840927 RepID=A0A9D1FD48_9FIRM|nr:ATP-dependent RecD-like DNA helicase [Candidatus Scatomorpha merdipullorum]
MAQDTELEELYGKISSVIYTNEENGWTVLRMETDGGTDATVVGTLPSAYPGEELHVFGEWTTHPNHGRQFKSEYAERSLPRTKDDIYKYLAGRAVKGIGPATAALIVDRFGDRTLDVLERQPERLTEIRGISPAKAEAVTRDFRRQAQLRRLMEFLCAYGLKPLLAVRLYRFYGEEAMDAVSEDPYIIASPHIGGSFAEADRLALEQGAAADDPRRVRAAAVFELRHNAGNGHCFIPTDKLAAATACFIGVEHDSALAAVEALAESGAVVRTELAGRDVTYLAELYAAETRVASRLLGMVAEKPSDVDADGLLDALEREQGVKYAPKQREAVRLAAKSRVMALTGGPGTGKTTSLRAILAVFDALGLTTLLTAPTGRAAKRMSSLTGRDAATMHRLLGAGFSPDGESVVFARDEENPLDCSAVVLDECSMVDITLMDALLRAMPEDARLVLVGDADQLPSVGPGRVFADILSSGVIPAVRLTEIFRQAGKSRIVSCAHQINAGEQPDLTANTGGLFFLRRGEAVRAAETVSELCSARLPSRMGIPVQDIEVLSPTRKGEAGTVALNRRLQAALNPPAEGKNEKIFGSVTFREGDRVMQIRNNYDMIWRKESPSGPPETGAGIYNGDMGEILAIDAESETLTVDFDGRIAQIGFDALSELEHAWAVTVHKSQGSEYRAVVLAVGEAAPRLMTRGVLYTAVTRARELLIIVGDEGAARRMIDNHVQSRRYSGLKLRLKG